MRIRVARQEDIPEICHIYELAREHMRAEGNTSQWRMEAVALPLIL